MTTKTYVPMLIAQTGPTAGQTWVLSKDALIIGRDAECDIVIPDRQVSRQHARLCRAEATFALEDLGSKNGTHVNGALIDHPKPLQDGDLIQIALVAKLQFLGTEATMPMRLDTATARVTGPLLGVSPTVPSHSTQRLRLDSAARRLWIGDAELDPPLSMPQFRFMELLCAHAGKVCTREEVIQIVWPEAQGAGVSEQAIDALVRRIRDRLAELDAERQYIVTVRGHGFRLENPEQ